MSLHPTGTSRVYGFSRGGNTKATAAAQGQEGIVIPLLSFARLGARLCSEKRNRTGHHYNPSFKLLSILLGCLRTFRLNVFQDESFFLF